MVQHPVARVLQNFIHLHHTQLQSFLFIYIIFVVKIPLSAKKKKK
jgi:hypothetical protein